jgi:precorrin-3B C17-methyltransferase
MGIDMKIYAVGLGPGEISGMTGRALEVLRESQVIVGYELYISLLGPLVEGKEVLTTPMKREVERCKMAVDLALGGKRVAMVSSGDAGVYGMAGVLHEVAADYPQLSIEVIPGITAACSAAAVLGAPLTHDFAVISLSDLLTPWEKIETRLKNAAQADFVICLYNPASKKRADYLGRACAAVMEYIDGDTPCGYVRNIGRDGQGYEILTLKELAVLKADMFTTVIIGNSTTKVIGGKLVTPRGYRGV